MTEHGDVLAVPDVGITEVDVNSTVYLQMNDEEIAEEVAALAGIERAEIASLTRRAEQLAAVTTAQTAAVAYLKELSKRAAADEPITEAALEKLGRLEEQVAAEVEAYAEIVGAPASTFFRKSGYQRLDEERNRVLARSADIMARAAAVRWRVEAGLSKDGMSIPIHLPNYDDLPEGALRLVLKLAPSITTSELRRQLTAASLLSRSLNQLIAEQHALDEQLLVPLQVRLRELRILLLDDLSTLGTLHDDLAGRMNGIREGERLVAALEALRAMLLDVRAQCGQALATLGGRPGAGMSSGTAEDGGGADDVAGADISGSGLRALLACAEVMGDVLDEGLPAKLADIEEAAEALQQRVAGEPRLQQDVGDLAPVHEVLAVYEEVDGSWRSTFVLMLGAREQLDGPLVRTDSFTDRTLAEIANTAIQLTRTRRDEDDAVFYRAALVKDGIPVKMGTDHSLRVVQAGLRLDVSGSVNFLRPRSLWSGEEAFRAAPALTATLHYHDWRSSHAHRGNWLWNFLDPGLGIHVAYPDLGTTRRDGRGGVLQQDPAAEVGLGGVFQLFGDLVQVGYGYDLQVQRAYWYVGFGLQTLTNLGISLPVARGVLGGP